MLTKSNKEFYQKSNKNKCKVCCNTYQKEYRKKRRCETTLKYCAKCNRTKTLAEFHKSKLSSDKHALYCKMCIDYINFTHDKNRRIRIDIDFKICKQCEKLKSISEYNYSDICEKCQLDMFKRELELNREFADD
jgi:hypothetical protein